jgi:hypothetical protein
MRTRGYAAPAQNSLIRNGFPRAARRDTHLPAQQLDESDQARPVVIRQRTLRFDANFDRALLLKLRGFPFAHAAPREHAEGRFFIR